MTTTELLDLEEELPRRERRRLVTPVGVGAVAVVIAAAGFFGGVQVQKSRGGTTGSGAGAAGAGRFSGGFGAAGAAGGARSGGGAAGAGAATAGAGGGTAGAGGGAGAGQAGGATVGQVASVDGKTLYVDESSGTTVRVRLAKGGTVTRTAKAHVTSIHPGDTVVVQGETTSSGTVVASTIRATASNAAGAAFGGFGGFGGAAPGAQGAPGGG